MFMVPRAVILVVGLIQTALTQRAQSKKTLRLAAAFTFALARPSRDWNFKLRCLFFLNGTPT
jgi:hypothetical protein